MNAGGVMVKAARWHAQCPWLKSGNYTFSLLHAKPVDRVLGPVYSMYELVWVGISLYEHSTYMLNTRFHIAYTRTDV